MSSTAKQIADKNQIDLYILPADPSIQIWGMDCATRIQKQFTKFSVDSPYEVNLIQDVQSVKEKSMLLLRGDVVYDWAVLDGLCMKSDIAIIDEDGTVLGAHLSAGNIVSELEGLTNSIKRIAPKDAGSGYRDALRKKEDPYAIIVNPDNVQAVQWRLYQGSYKGVTDLVTKYWWPVPAFHVTRLCANLGLSPNMVTSIGAVLMFAALYLFAIGFYGWGLLAGWIMTFLDTVDGKLARVTLTSSKWGNIFDHGIDLVHPPFWYIAWGYGLVHYGTPLAGGMLTFLLIAMFVFYVLGRLCEGYFIARFKIHLHVWRKLDSAFRLISSRRNPNMIVLTLCALSGRPDIGLIIITAWGGITFAIHIVQIFQAELTAQVMPINSWLKAGS